MKINNKLKKHFKEGIITLAIAGITGLFAVANVQVEKYKETKAYYTENQCVVLTADEVNNIKFYELADKINNNPDINFDNTNIVYNNRTFELSEYVINESITYYSPNNDDRDTSNIISFTLDGANSNFGKFKYYNDTDVVDLNFEYSLNWYSEYVVNAFKESTITLTPTQLNDTTYSYLRERINNNGTNEFVNSIIEYNNEFFTLHDFEVNDSITWQSSNNNEINFWLDSDNGFTLNQDNNFIDSITIFNASYIVDNINAPFETDDIIPTISGGLTLIGDLANEFLTGFSTLFWDSVGNKLTNFGIYSLTMLGVAITFAVIKLCLSVLRRDTGA